jgi:hypothetical protein
LVILGNMIASLCSVWLQKLLVYFCDCKKRKKYWTTVWLQIFGVPDCNQYLCVVAKRKPDFVCVVEKLLGYLEYDCKPG